MLVATQNKVYDIIGDGGFKTPMCRLDRFKVGAIDVSGTCQIVVREDGFLQIWLEEVASGWQKLEIEGVVTSALILNALPLTLLIGTEPPHLFKVAAEKGETERMLDFDRLDCRKEWSTPWGGPPAVRSMAQGGGETVYADIHVGSIMRSDDNGRSWQPVKPDLHKDVHQVNTCLAAPDRVYANTADAVWISEDRGDSWQHRPFPVEAAYGRAIAIHPEDPDCLLATVSDGPHGDNVHGRLFRSDDAGQNWVHVTEGFPEYTRDNINTHQIAFDRRGRAWAAVGEALYRGDDRGKSWQLAWHAQDTIEKLSD